MPTLEEAKDIHKFGLVNVNSATDLVSAGRSYAEKSWIYLTKYDESSFLKTHTEVNGRYPSWDNDLLYTHDKLTKTVVVRDP